MHLDPALQTVVACLVVVLIAGVVLRLMHQPYVVAYILAGAVLGPDGLGIVDNRAIIERIGAFGVVLLLFFIGMEVSPHRLLSNWRIPVVGTLLQIALSVALVSIFGFVLDWNTSRIILIGFVVSLSSTAVVLKLLEDAQELNSPVGEQTIGILLVQDVLIVPMMIVVSLLSGQRVVGEEMGLQLVGAALTIGVVVWLVVHPRVRLPFAQRFRGDHELQIFAALAVCFAFALVTGLFHLSSALGAFVAGMVVGAAQETKWIRSSLHAFHVVLVAMFFLSVGLLVDLTFFRDNFATIAGLALVAISTNTFVNASALRLLGQRWRESLYAGAFLSQIGEFSFVLAALGAQTALISEYGYQLAISTISLTLIVSPLWIATARRLLHKTSATSPSFTG